MSVTQQIPYTSATGNGVTTVFPFDFELRDDADLLVYIDEVLQVSGYTVAGFDDPDGGTVTFTTAPDSGAVVEMKRQVVLERTGDFQEKGDLPASSLNNELDRVLMALQDQYRDIDVLRIEVDTVVDDVAADLAAAQAAAAAAAASEAAAAASESAASASATAADVSADAAAASAIEAANSAASVSGLLDTVRTDVATATTVNLTTSAPSTRHIRLTGTTQVDGFTVAQGKTYFVKSAAAFTLTNNAAIVTNTGADIAVDANASFILRATAADTVEILCFTPGTAAGKRTDIGATSTGGSLITAASASAARTAIGFGEALAAGTYRSFTASGTNTYSITPDPALSAYAAAVEYVVTFTNANTSTTNTLQISGLASPPSLVKQDSSGAYVALAVGDIFAGMVSRVILLSTTQALLVSPKPAASGGASTSANNTWTKAQRGSITALTDGATITPDFNDNNFYSVTLGGNRTLANPTNIVAGQSGSIFITQDGTGSRTLAYGSYFKFPFGSAPTLTTTASAVDRLDYVVESTTRIHASLTKAVA